MEIPNAKPFSLSGPLSYRLRSLAHLFWATVSTPVRRSVRGPRVPGWTATFELSTRFLRMQNIHAFDKDDINEGRAYYDSLIFHTPALEKMSLVDVQEPVKGLWVRSPEAQPKKIIYNLHGGGYAFYPKLSVTFMAEIVQFTCANLFALDYPLIPEHPYPAQLNAALQAYRWLLVEGHAPEDITVMGDSAGGNLTLALLLKLREKSLPMPSGAVAISPWTDVSNSGASMLANEATDWVTKRMGDKWADWYLAGRSPSDPFISPLFADLRGLPPIYIQAGGKEILIDQIKAFYEAAAQQGAQVKLDIWENMNHDFQAYGDILEEARDALERIASFIAR